VKAKRYTEEQIITRLRGGASRSALQCCHCFATTLADIPQKIVESETKPGLDISFNKFYNRDMEGKSKRQFAGIRIQREILHQARVAAVIQKKTLGQWLEEAIAEKIEREKDK